jgi:dGTPase
MRQLHKEDKEAKKFLYKDDFEYLDGVRKDCQLENIRTIDVQIIDLADEIAYAVHDLEDSLALRYFNIDELLYEIKLKDQNAYQQFEHMVLDSKRFAGDSCSYKTIQEYSQVFRKRLTSVLTNEFINDVTILEVNDSQIISEHGTKPHQYELSLDKYKNLSKLLKSHIFSCVTRDSDIMLYEQKGEIIIKSLFELLSDKKLNKDGKLLPPDFRPNNDYSLVQGSIDYIAGMMDTFAISEYERLYRVKFSDIIIKDKNKNSITLIF